MIGIAISIVLGLLLLTGPPWWFQFFRHDGSASPTSTTTTMAPSGLNVIGFTGTCDRFTVYAQNRYPPVGTKKMNAPDIASTQIGGFAPNEKFAVDGWVHSRPAYPSNSPPWNSDVWFHVADGGWVSFGGVRVLQTEPDPSGGHGDGGDPVPTLPTCEGVTR